MHKDLSQHQFDGVDARDEFNRKPIAEKIIKLLTSDIDLSPMIIDGDWGTGKSEFCHKLINKFRAEYTDAQILYIDAFQADHADNPLMTIIAEIMTLIPDEQKKKGFLKKALPAIRYGTKAVLKAGVSHIMKESADSIADGFEKEIQDAANAAIDATVTALLKDHEEAEKNLKALQALLTELAQDNPIIIFIDELDRCRPDFSVQMLEVIKHTFNVENVKFVLVTNSNQLKAAINHAYGASIDSTRYLDKFIKFTITLPDKFDANYNEAKIASIEHFNNLLSQSPILQNTTLIKIEHGQYKSPAINVIHRLIETNKLSLREVETFIRYIEITNSLGISMINTNHGYLALYVIAVYIKCFESELANQIQNELIDAEKIYSIFAINPNTDIQASWPNFIALLLASHTQINSESAIEYIKQYDSKRGNGSYSMEDSIFNSSFGFRATSYFSPILEVLNTLQLNK